MISEPVLYVQYINKNKHLKLLNFLWFCIYTHGGGSSRAIDSNSSKQETTYLYGTQRFITIFLKAIIIYLHLYRLNSFKHIKMLLLNFCVFVSIPFGLLYMCTCFYVNCHKRHVYIIITKSYRKECNVFLFILLDINCNKGYQFTHNTNVCFLINCIELMKLIVY